MRPLLRKFIGISLILLAIFGMLFSALGVIGVWKVRESLLITFQDSTELLIGTLETTSKGLLVVDDSLNAASGTVEATTRTTETMAQSLGEINSIANGIVGIVNLVGGGLETPDTQNLNFSEDVQILTINLNRVSSNLGEAQEVVDDYQLAIDNAKTRLIIIQENGPTWITILVIGLTILFLWLAIAQIALLLQGVDLVKEE